MTYAFYDTGIDELVLYKLVPETLTLFFFAKW